MNEDDTTIPAGKWITAPDGRIVVVRSTGEPFRGSLARAMGRPSAYVPLAEGDVPMGAPLGDGIGDDVVLTATVDDRPVLAGTLIHMALIARCNPGGELLPFLYRDPIDPEAPDEPRPLRRAVLAIVDDQIIPEG